MDSALFSTLSMTRLATVTDTGEPMAVPNFCLKNSPLYARKVASRQNWRSFATCSAKGAVHLENELSALSLSLATLAARSAGTFLKRDITSNVAQLARTRITRCLAKARPPPTNFSPALPPGQGKCHRGDGSHNI